MYLRMTMQYFLPQDILWREKTRYKTKYTKEYGSQVKAKYDYFRKTDDHGSHRLPRQQ